MNEVNIVNIFGARLKEARQKANLTQAELAEKVGMSLNFIGMIERGERNTILANVYKIILAVNGNLEDFFKGL